MTTKPINTIEMESETSLSLSEDEFITAVDRGELLEVTKNTVEYCIISDEIYNIYCPQVREHAGYMYGITYESIRSIISNSKLAVIHCSPEVNNDYA